MPRKAWFGDLDEMTFVVLRQYHFGAVFLKNCSILQYELVMVGEFG